MIDFFNEIFTKFLNGVVALLPRSPFTVIIDKIGGIPHLDWLNWFFPVQSVLTVFALWLSAVSLFYLYSIIMRWVRAIK